MDPSIAVIVNNSAGADDKKHAVDHLADVLRSSGVDARITLAKSGAEIADAARRAVREKPRAIVAGGGDGTLNAVASALFGTSIPFGVLPMGTLNHFARDLGIPQDIDAAAQVIIAGHVTQIDVGDVNGRIFLNNSSLGLYPSMVRHREKQQEQLGRSKRSAAAWAALAVLRRYAFLSVRLNTGGQALVRRTPLVFIGNNRYKMEGLKIGGRERLDAGVLSLYLAHRTGRLGLVWLAVRALFGHLREAKDFDALWAEEIWIETRRSQIHVATDGEVNLMETPLHYRVRPRALYVIVPESGGPGG